MQLYSLSVSYVQWLAVHDIIYFLRDYNSVYI